MQYGWIRKPWVLPLVLGSCVLLAIAIIKLQAPLQHEAQVAYVTPVQVIELQQYAIRPTITGFGLVEPDILLEAKSEISGKVVYVHPLLRDGVILAKDTEVIRIEPVDYELSLQQAQADVAVSKAQLREIKLRVQNTRVDLKLAQDKLALSQKDLQRNQALLTKKVISQSSVDAQQAKVLQLKQEVQNLKSLLRTLPEQQRSLEATLANSEAAAQTQQRDLERTSIRLPFNARISELAVDENQFVNQGALLFSAQTTDKILINAQFPLQQFRILAKGFEANKDLLKAAFLGGFSSELFVQLGLTAKVSLAADTDLFWDAKVERISSSLDATARTLGVVVSVDKPYEQMQPGIKPPLMEGMYTRVSLQGVAKMYYPVPREALHEGEIFLSSTDHRLIRLRIEPEQIQGNLALFDKGLNAGDQLIVSDVFPAIPDMLLEPVQDESMQQQVRLWAGE